MAGLSYLKKGRFWDEKPTPLKQGLCRPFCCPNMLAMEYGYARV
jgi:hypothetical protein